MALDTITIVSGVFSILFVAISSYVGLRIAYKYVKMKQKVFLCVGFAWVGIVSPWWPSSLSFIIALFNGGEGLLNAPEIYFIVGNVMIPLFVLLWMIAYTELLAKKQQKIILLLIIVYGVVFELIFWILLLTDSTAIGVLKGPVDVDYESIILVFLLATIGILLVTGVKFGKASLTPDATPDVRLKGKLLIAAIITWAVGALLDSAIPLNLLTLPITRILLISSSILFLGGWILPDWMKKLFGLKEA